jgi:predicted ATPase/class 3 adenylate cyclase
MPPGTSLPTGTLTFLFSDIEGSTRLLVALGERFTDVLEQHQRILREAFAAGHEVGTEGDSFFVVFPGASDAVAAAVAAQRALAAEDWGAMPVRVRMGLHTGDGRLGGDNYVGLDVHRAARIAAAAHGGQVLLSGTTHALVAGHLPERVTVRDLGEHTLKDLAAPERLLQLEISGLPTDFDPPSALATRPNNLPRQLSSLVGRDDEVARISELLERAPLVTLTGPGGVGKTRLAQQVAAAVLERYPDGVFLVSLADLREADQVIPELGRVLGLRDAGPSSFDERLRRYLEHRRMLLVLDNLEHLGDAAPQLGDLLRTSSVSMLATSRSRLQVDGEQDVPVGPLAADSMTAPAVRLFAERAAAIDPDFKVTDDNVAAIMGICVRLDGLPLAIELAAAHVRMASPAEILERIGSSLAGLGQGRRDLPQRQRTLRATIDWSYGLLVPAEADLLDRLSVFAGGFDIAAADSVAGVADEPHGQIMPLLARLVDQSLVSVVSGGAHRRFRLLQTIRDAAVDRLHNAGEWERTAARHAAHYLGIAQRLGPLLATSQVQAAFAELSTEQENLRETMRNALARNDPQAAIALAHAVWRFWAQSGHMGEGREWVAAALASGAARDDGPLRAKGLLVSGLLAYWQGDLGACRIAMADAARIARAINTPGLLAEALANLAWIKTEDEREQARNLFGEARELAHAAGRPDIDLLCRVGLGRAEIAAGNLDAAETLESSALAELEAMGDLTLLGACLGMLGEVARARGDVRTATRLYRRMMALPSPTPESPIVTFNLASAARALVELDPVVALRLAGAASSHALKLGIEEPSATIGLGDPRQIALHTQPEELVASAYADGQRLSPHEALSLLEEALERISPA